MQVTLANGREGELAYRQGYFADKEFAKLNGVERERQLEEALMLENPITDITIAMEVNYFQLNRAEYFVPVAVKIPGSELALARRRGAQRTTLDFIGEVKDDYGITHPERARQARHQDLAIATADAAGDAADPVRDRLHAAAGKYVIKFLARDAEAGRIGTYQTSFTIPNLNREETRLPISSVVLAASACRSATSCTRVKSSLGNEAIAANPLVHEGEKLLPSVTRVFSTRQGPATSTCRPTSAAPRRRSRSWRSSPSTRAT